MPVELQGPVVRPLFFIKRLPQTLCLLLVFVLALLPAALHAHPQDENIILDIELGQMQLQAAQMDEEYLAALKRKRLRQLAALPWRDKFVLYVDAGFEHILPKGLDHILFVLGLFFASLFLAGLLWQVTAFTLAHSITLGLASTGTVTAPGSVVEPLIALSILWIALENCLFSQASRWRPAIVFGFGLLHGLGFAAVLKEYGLPREDLLSSLLAFNLGVELGQISVIVMALVATVLIRKKAWYRQRVQIPVSICIGLVGLYWFIERTLLQ